MTRAHLLGLLALNGSVNIHKQYYYFIAFTNKFKMRIYIDRCHLSYKDKLGYQSELDLSFQNTFELLRRKGYLK